MSEEKSQEQESVSVEQAVARFLISPEVAYLSPATITEYRHELTRFAAWAKEHSVLLEQVNAWVIADFIVYIRRVGKPRKRGKQELSTYTIAGQVRVLQTWLHWCLDDEEYSQHVSFEVIRRIKQPKVVKTVVETLSIEQITALRLACRKEESPFLRMRDEALLLLLLETGIRAQEVCTLTVAHVDLSDADSHIKIFGKGGKWGEVGIGMLCRDALSRYWQAYRSQLYQEDLEQILAGRRTTQQERYVLERRLKETSLFFLNRRGKPLTTSGLRRMLARLDAWANIQLDRCSPHTFRHTFSVLFMRQGGNVYDLSKLLRHSEIATTEDYLRTLPQWEVRHRAKSIVDSSFIEKVRQPLPPQETIKILSQPQSTGVSGKDWEGTLAEYEQWTTFLWTWWKRLGEGAWISTSEVRNRLSDVLPASLKHCEERHLRSFLYQLRIALQQRSEVFYGEDCVSVKWKSGPRGMKVWQVYQMQG